MCRGQKNPSWHEENRYRRRRTEKSNLKGVDRTIHTEGGQSMPIIENQLCRERRRFRSIKAKAERCEQNTSHWGVFETRSRPISITKLEKIYPAEMCPATKIMCPAESDSTKQRLPHTLWNHRLNSFTNKQMMDSASIYRQRNQQRHKKTTHPKQGGKLKQVLP